MKTGTLFIICAVSGGGKSTLAQHLMKTFSDLEFSISATSRPRRETEVNGKDYYFLSTEEFENKIKNNEFLEYATIHLGKYYGTLQKPIDEKIQNGKSVLLDIDVQGFDQIKRNYDRKVVSIFIKTPTLEIARERLVARGTNTPEQIEERIARGKKELEWVPQFDHVVINDKLDDAKKDIEKIFRLYL